MENECLSRKVIEIRTSLADNKKEEVRETMKGRKEGEGILTRWSPQEINEKGHGVCRLANNKLIHQISKEIVHIVLVEVLRGLSRAEANCKVGEFMQTTRMR